MLCRMLHNTNKWNRQDISNVAPLDKSNGDISNTTLLTQQGLLIAHSLIYSSTKQLATMIANISNGTVELKKLQQIAVLEELEIEEQARDDSDQQEIDMIQTGDNIQKKR